MASSDQYLWQEQDLEGNVVRQTLLWVTVLGSRYHNQLCHIFSHKMNIGVVGNELKETGSSFSCGSRLLWSHQNEYLDRYATEGVQ